MTILLGDFFRVHFGHLKKKAPEQDPEKSWNIHTEATKQRDLKRIECENLWKDYQDDQRPGKFIKTHIKTGDSWRSTKAFAFQSLFWIKMIWHWKKSLKWSFPIISYNFLSHGGTPRHHPFIIIYRWIFHETIQLYQGVPHDHGNHPVMLPSLHRVVAIVPRQRRFQLLRHLAVWDCENCELPGHILAYLGISPWTAIKPHETPYESSLIQLVLWDLGISWVNSKLWDKNSEHLEDNFRVIMDIHGWQCQACHWTKMNQDEHCRYEVEQAEGKDWNLWQLTVLQCVIKCINIY